MNPILLLLILGACLAPIGALPMTNDQELTTALDSIEQQPSKEQLSHESQFVGRIAPRNHEDDDERMSEEQQFDTFVRELQAAGVQTAERRDLHTLTYKELARLLALYQFSQGRNYYDAAEGQKEQSSPPPKQVVH